MKLLPLYQSRFSYSHSWAVALASRESTEGQHLSIAESSCNGRVEGTFRGINHPRRRGDGTFEPNFQGVIETTDGATILLDSKGYGSASLAGERQVVVSGTHVSDHEKYIWLNNTIAVGEGAVNTLSSGKMEFVFSWYELVWEPIAQ